MSSIVIGASLTIFFIAVIAELFTRFYYYKKEGHLRFLSVDPMEKSFFFKPHPYCLYVKKEGMPWPYPSNELGYVGKRRIMRSKSSERKRLYFVGGSTTEEAEERYGTESHWPGQFTALLNEKSGIERFECINAACAGYTTAESLAEFIFRGIDLKPDYLIVYHNVNDVWTVQMLESFTADYSAARISGLFRRPLVSRLPQIPVSFLYQMLRRRIISEFTHRSLINYISNPPWKIVGTFDESRLGPFARNLTSLINLSRCCNCVPILLNWEHSRDSIFQTGHYLGESMQFNPIYQRYVYENNKIISEVADSLDVIYANVGPFNEEYFQRDGMHFNQRGRTEFAKRLVDDLFDRIT